jgi:protein ImuA
MAAQRSDPSFPAVWRRILADKTVKAEVGAGVFSFGLSALDRHLKGGLRRAALHEIYASGVGDFASAAGFAAALACRAAQDRLLCWVQQDFLDVETGGLHPPGLAELGLAPDRLVLIRARDGAGVLRAGAEAARCASLGAVVIAPWGAPREFDLTASRRLTLIAETSCVPLLLLRVAVAAPHPSAAQTRWLVRAAPSQAQAARAPGLPAFHVSLLRHRGGVASGEWRLEWSRDKRSFEPGPDFRPEFTAKPGAAPLSRSMVPAPANRPARAEGDLDRRQAG